MSDATYFTNDAGARDVLRRLTTEQLIDGLNRGARKLRAMPDPEEYAGGTFVDRENIGHPNAEMNESVKGMQHYASGFAKIRLTLETAMVDTYQEIKRRGVSMDVSGIRMHYLHGWVIPAERVLSDGLSTIRR